MQKFRIGIMGGRRGASLLYYTKYLEGQMEITALCENDPKVIEEIKANPDMDISTVTFYDNFDEFIDSGIDAVYLANYFHEHAKYAIKALERGIHVFSETTAAPSYAECVELIEAQEKSGAKYMLAANCVYFRAVQAMKKNIDEGKIGKVVYADAEYVHPSTPNINGYGGEIDKTNLHWRNTLPGCYYNMHDLGPLMFMTGSTPKRVVAKAAFVPGANPKPLVSASRCDALVETDSGAVFHYSGCTGVGTKGKWYRIAGTGGTLESVRFDEAEKKIVIGGLHEEPEIKELAWSDLDLFTKEEEEKYFVNDGKDLGHGGIDFVLVLDFLKVLKGEKEPYFDVYRAVDLSATAITAWYSVLSGSSQLEIPNFRDKAVRDKYRNDYRKPFAKNYDDLTLPCAPDFKEEFKAEL